MALVSSRDHHIPRQASRHHRPLTRRCLLPVDTTEQRQWLVELTQCAPHFASVNLVRPRLRLWALQIEPASLSARVCIQVLEALRPSIPTIASSDQGEENR